jgi:hypothetical protein
VTEPNVTATLRITGGAKPNKTEGGKSFTAKALPPSFFGVRWQSRFIGRHRFGSFFEKNIQSAVAATLCRRTPNKQIAADETPRLADLPGSSKGDERNDSEKVFERINQSR